VNDEELSRSVISLREALDLADENDTDLIEIAADRNGVSICKLIDLDKYLYQEKKKAKALKASQKKSEQKEIKLGVDIAENDFSTKERHAREFLTKDDNVKVTLQLRGRRRDSQVIKDQAMALVLRFSESLSDVGKTSSMPVWQGPRLILQINPK
jgi:translation initiation factor IF-3